MSDYSDANFGEALKLLAVVALLIAGLLGCAVAAIAYSFGHSHGVHDHWSGRWVVVDGEVKKAKEKTR